MEREINEIRFDEVEYDAAFSFSVLVPAATHVLAGVRFAEVSDSQNHADPVGRFQLFLQAQTTAIGYHVV